MAIFGGKFDFNNFFGSIGYGISPTRAWFFPPDIVPFSAANQLKNSPRKTADYGGFAIAGQDAMDRADQCWGFSPKPTKSINKRKGFRF